MLIESSQAQHFTDHYQALLGHVALVGNLLKTPIDPDRALALMTEARDALAADKSLLDKAAAAMEKAGTPLPQDIYDAAASLRVNHWVYLRDTTAYSVFLETGAIEAAYGVKGLNESIRDIMGDSGAVINAGLLEYAGCIVCDGLIALGAWLGPNHRSSFNEQLRVLRAEGKFSRDTLVPISAPKKKTKAARPASK